MRIGPPIRRPQACCTTAFPTTSRINNTGNNNINNNTSINNNNNSVGNADSATTLPLLAPTTEGNNAQNGNQNARSGRPFTTTDVAGNHDARASPKRTIGNGGGNGVGVGVADANGVKKELTRGHHCAVDANRANKCKKVAEPKAPVKVAKSVANAIHCERKSQNPPTTSDQLPKGNTKRPAQHEQAGRPIANANAVPLNANHVARSYQKHNRYSTSQHDGVGGPQTTNKNDKKDNPSIVVSSSSAVLSSGAQQPSVVGWAKIKRGDTTTVSDTENSNSNNNNKSNTNIVSSAEDKKSFLSFIPTKVYVTERCHADMFTAELDKALEESLRLLSKSTEKYARSTTGNRREVVGGAGGRAKYVECLLPNVFGGDGSTHRSKGLLLPYSMYQWVVSPSFDFSGCGDNAAHKDVEEMAEDTPRTLIVRPQRTPTTHHSHTEGIFDVADAGRKGSILGTSSFPFRSPSTASSIASSVRLGRDLAEKLTLSAGSSLSSKRTCSVSAGVDIREAAGSSCRSSDGRREPYNTCRKRETGKRSSSESRATNAGVGAGWNAHASTSVVVSSSITPTTKTVVRHSQDSSSRLRTSATTTPASTVSKGWRGTDEGNEGTEGADDNMLMMPVISIALPRDPHISRRSNKTEMRHEGVNSDILTSSRHHLIEGLAVREAANWVFRATAALTRNVSAVDASKSYPPSNTEDVRFADSFHSSARLVPMHHFLLLELSAMRSSLFGEDEDAEESHPALVPEEGCSIRRYTAGTLSEAGDEGYMCKRRTMMSYSQEAVHRVSDLFVFTYTLPKKPHRYGEREAEKREKMGCDNGIHNVDQKHSLPQQRDFSRWQQCVAAFNRIGRSASLSRRKGTEVDGRRKVVSTPRLNAEVSCNNPDSQLNMNWGHRLRTQVRHVSIRRKELKHSQQWKKFEAGICMPSSTAARHTSAQLFPRLVPLLAYFSGFGTLLSRDSSFSKRSLEMRQGHERDRREKPSSLPARCGSKSPSQPSPHCSHPHCSQRQQQRQEDIDDASLLSLELGDPMSIALQSEALLCYTLVSMVSISLFSSVSFVVLPSTSLSHGVGVTAGRDNTSPPHPTLPTRTHRDSPCVFPPKSETSPTVVFLTITEFIGVINSKLALVETAKASAVEGFVAVRMAAARAFTFLDEKEERSDGSTVKKQGLSGSNKQTLSTVNAAASGGVGPFTKAFASLFGFTEEDNQAIVAAVERRREAREKRWQKRMTAGLLISTTLPPPPLDTHHGNACIAPLQHNAVSSQHERRSDQPNNNAAPLTVAATDGSDHHRNSGGSADDFDTAGLMTMTGQTHNGISTVQTHGKQFVTLPRPLTTAPTTAGVTTVPVRKGTEGGQVHLQPNALVGTEAARIRNSSLTSIRKGSFVQLVPRPNASNHPPTLLSCAGTKSTAQPHEITKYKDNYDFTGRTYDSSNSRKGFALGGGPMRLLTLAQQQQQQRHGNTSAAAPTASLASDAVRSSSNSGGGQSASAQVHGVFDGQGNLSGPPRHHLPSFPSLSDDGAKGKELLCGQSGGYESINTTQQTMNTTCLVGANPFLFDRSRGQQEVTNQTCIGHDTQPRGGRCQPTPAQTPFGSSSNRRDPPHDHRAPAVATSGEGVFEFDSNFTAYSGSMGLQLPPPPPAFVTLPNPTGLYASTASSSSSSFPLLTRVHRDANISSNAAHVATTISTGVSVPRNLDNHSLEHQQRHPQDTLQLAHPQLFDFSRGGGRGEGPIAVHASNRSFYPTNPQPHVTGDRGHWPRGQQQNAQYPPPQQQQLQPSSTHHIF